ncbi:MAG: MotA/TolQ/ExbB proton channel family protein [Puniceicoccaceae bacterium]
MFASPLGVLAQEGEAPAQQTENGTQAENGTPVPVETTGRDELGDVATIDWGEELAKGGWVGVVLIVLMFASLAFVVERLISVRRKAFLPGALVESTCAKWEAGDLEGAAEAARGDRSAYGRTVRYLARHAHFPYSVVSATVADIGAREVQSQMRRSYPLVVIATISPLLGLLGTIIGMIESFQKVALLGDTGDAAVLADSIGKALITTALGLIIAIPTLGFYHYFRSRISGFATALEESVEELLGIHVQYLMKWEEDAEDAGNAPAAESDPEES